MEYTEFEALLRVAFSKNELPTPNEEQISRFYHFTEHLVKVNSVTNLTAIRSIPDIIYKHYVDSLLVMQFIPTNAKILDLGCGPGFPSIPLAIMRPDVSITALDSTAKKISFVKESVDLLSLKNLSAISGRAEDVKVRSTLGSFDVVVSRAVARLNVLCELCIPYLRLGGDLLALKGAKAEEELLEAEKAIEILGGTYKTIHKLSLNTDDATEARGIIHVVKIKQTPEQYPRSYAAIVKKTL